MDAGCKKQRLGPWDSFPDLSTAACELKAATTISKLEACAGEECHKDFEAFYERLRNLQNSCEVNSPWYKPIIVSVEGILGKTVGQDLGDMVSQSSVRVACAQPASLSIVKGIFDQVGGAVATAFDVVSNYMVVQECKDICAAERTPLVFIIYNFCSSVLSCRLGASGESMVWPPGLPKPRLQLVVVRDPAASSPKLAKVSRSLQKLEVDQISLSVNGLSDGEILDVVKCEINKAMFPSTVDLESLLGADPLRCLVNAARKEGLLRDISGDKKWQLGRRGKHVPWSFQLATPSCSPGGPPSVRNLGIHSVTETGFIFFSLGSAGGAAGQAGEEVPASMVLLLGSYPFQQQWRGEGVVRKMRWGSPAPPFSLACAMERCREHWQQGPAQRRMALSDQEAVLGTREDDTREGPSTAYIFIPQRMEVLIGHPPAPGGTRRCEWQRWASRRWEDPRAVLPFSPKPVVMAPKQPRFRKVTVVLMGPHTSGKTTVRNRLAERLHWRSDEELGASLRGEEEEKGHYHKAWDDTIHQAEVARDQERRSTATSRVVETWHLGNFAWALTRHPEQQEHLLKRAVDAIGQEQETGIVLMVLLKTDAATMVRRRASFQTSVLSFQDEEADAAKLSKATGEKLEEILDSLFAVKLPLLKLENQKDGEAVLNDTVDAILDFITFFV